MTSNVTRIIKVEPVSEERWGAQPSTIGVQFNVKTINGVTENEYESTVVLFMTWKNGGWTVTDGDIRNNK